MAAALRVGISMGGAIPVGTSLKGATEKAAPRGGKAVRPPACSAQGAFMGCSEVWGQVWAAAR